jgi:hypothetical protein
MHAVAWLEASTRGNSTWQQVLLTHRRSPPFVRFCLRGLSTFATGMTGAELDPDASFSREELMEWCATYVNVVCENDKADMPEMSFKDEVTAADVQSAIER